jgi:hypothetical protein
MCVCVCSGFILQRKGSQFPSLSRILSFPDIVGQIWSKKRANEDFSISRTIVENQILFLMKLILQFMDL